MVFAATPKPLSMQRIKGLPFSSSCVSLSRGCSGEAASSDEEVKAGEWEKRLPKKVQERMAAKRQAAEAGWVQEVWDSATGQFRLHS
eukprot:3938173-Rhodomonas_salina.1